MKDVVFVTGNANKARYFAELIGISVDHHAVDTDEIQSMDLRAVALHKAKQAYAITKRPVLVEDQGMYLTAMDGFPGPFVKYMIGGSGKLDLDIIVKALHGFDDRTAEAKTVFVYYDGRESVTFEGSLFGTIATEPKGEGGWGWDPIFIPEGYGGRTRAELSKAEDEETYLAIKPIRAVKEFLLS